MNVLRVLILGALAGALLWIAGGCSGVDQIGEPQLADYTTLTVKYADPGPTPSPCDDYLPQLDGVAQATEWSTAEPIFVRMTGENGSGGPDYYLEVRALWSDESRLGGSDRIYFLIRYPDETLDASPDLLAYMRKTPDGAICSNPAEGYPDYCPSPVPDTDLGGANCDSVLVKPEYWTRIHKDGKEDQVLVLLGEVPQESSASALIDAQRSLLGSRVLGEGPVSGLAVGGGLTQADAWIWRAGRTNLQPVPQFPNWSAGLVEPNMVPENRFPLFLQKAGFMEDMWIGSGGAISDDAGLLPYVKNFGGNNPIPVPDRLNECPPDVRDPTEEQLAAVNGGVPSDLGLWWPKSSRFTCKTTDACSRIGTATTWSRRLLSGEFDAVRGWAMRTPLDPAKGPESSIDVRARATFTVSQDKAFPVRTLEVMRDLNTGRSDDLAIIPDNEHYYRITVGVLNGSASVGSGSTEIRLRFEPPRLVPNANIDRCKGN